jgi:uncharacterized protein YdaU (DUF1376 family)
MHYYKRNLGDYAKKAGRLTMIQHGAYNLLIDACYDREEFPTLEQAIEWTWSITDEEIEAVKFVLNRFFKIDKEGQYIQDRILQELLEYHEKADKNKQIAVEREAKRKQNSTNRAQPVDESSPNHKPITNNHKPLTNNQNKTIAKETFALPEWVNQEHWNIWLEKNKKKTDSQKQLALNKLKRWKDAGLDYKQALEDAAEGGWQGLHEPKQKGYTNQRDESRRIAASSIFTHENTKHLRTNQITEKDVFDA